MKKILAICKKDLVLILHDKAALIFMLLAPFLLTLALGAITGSFTSSGGNIQGVPIVVVNQDDGELGEVLASAFESEETMFALTRLEDVAAARELVESDQAAAAILIPAGFSASLALNDSRPPAASEAVVEVYTSPSRPISADVVQSMVTGVLSQIEVLPVGIQVTVEQLVLTGRAAPQDIPVLLGDLSTRLAQTSAGEMDQTDLSSIVIRLDEQSQAQQQDFNYIAYLAPGMAIFFLMYTVTQGGRSLLTERDQGTLPRMLISPTQNTVILGGKLLGIVVTGILQVGILVLVSSLLFGLEWGDPVAVLALILAVVLAATGWGILLASFARTSFQVSSLGSALMLLFGVLGGTFISIDAFSDTFRLVSKITPHAWASESFLVLAQGGGLGDILPALGALMVMAALLFVASVLVARRRWASGFMN